MPWPACVSHLHQRSRIVVAQFHAACIPLDLLKHLSHKGKELLHIPMGTEIEGHLPSLAHCVFLLVVSQHLAIKLGLLSPSLLMLPPLFQKQNLIRCQEQRTTRGLFAEFCSRFTLRVQCAVEFTPMNIFDRVRAGDRLIGIVVIHIWLLKALSVAKRTVHLFSLVELYYLLITLRNLMFKGVCGYHLRAPL